MLAFQITTQGKGNLGAKMPRLDENTQQYLQDAEQGMRARTSRAWDSFTNFALRDNVLEVAVGLM